MIKFKIKQMLFLLSPKYKGSMRLGMNIVQGNSQEKVIRRFKMKLNRVYHNRRKTKRRHTEIQLQSNPLKMKNKEIPKI